MGTGEDQAKPICSAAHGSEGHSALLGPWRPSPAPLLQPPGTRWLPPCHPHCSTCVLGWTASTLGLQKPAPLGVSGSLPTLHVASSPTSPLRVLHVHTFCASQGPLIKHVHGHATRLTSRPLGTGRIKDYLLTASCVTFLVPAGSEVAREPTPVGKQTISTESPETNISRCRRCWSQSQNLALQLSGCVALDQFLHLSGPQFAHLRNAKNEQTCE